MRYLKLESRVLFLLILIYHGLTAQVDLIPFGASWQYYDLGNEPSGNWADINYNDNNWSVNNAQLGYGDGDETTMINATEAPGSILRTAYFRHEFTINDVNDFIGFEISLIHDDGAIVYINGVEAVRLRLKNGNISYNTFANSESLENELYIFSPPASSFVSGTNVIAVEVHQHNNADSDLSFALNIEAQVAPSANIIRGPYLQKGTESSVVIKWRTDVPAQSIVNYGSSLGNLSSVSSDSPLKTEHEIEITGLSDASTYYYSISDQNGVIVPASSDLYFKTHPIIGAETPIRAWVLGDPGTANQNQRNVRDAYYNYTGTEHTDMILFLGDNAYGSGTDAQYQDAMFENMYEDKLKNTIAWSTLGNHDGYTADSGTQTGPYYDIFTFPKAGESGGIASGTEAFYSFDYGNIHFIVLESYETSRAVGGPMYQWAKMDIQNTSAQWIIVMFHHPPYTKGSHDSDNDFDSAGSLKEMRENFLPMLEDNGVDLVLSGHSHSYERSFFINGHYGKSNTFDPSTHIIANGNGDGKSNGDGEYEKDLCPPMANKGAVYITTGSAGKITGNGSLNHNAMYYSAKDLGSTVLEVNGDTLNIKFVRETGAIDDYFTILKGDSNIDTDNDGTPDCIDECPMNPSKTLNDICGCATHFIDSDNDGICDDIDDCVLLIHVNPFNMTDTTYEVIETITSDAILNSGLNMNFSAGKEIELQSKFEVKTGSTFHAYIQGCTN